MSNLNSPQHGTRPESEGMRRAEGRPLERSLNAVLEIVLADHLRKDYEDAAQAGDYQKLVDYLFIAMMDHSIEEMDTGQSTEELERAAKANELSMATYYFTCHLSISINDLAVLKSDCVNALSGHDPESNGMTLEQVMEVLRENVLSVKKDLRRQVEGVTERADDFLGEWLDDRAKQEMFDGSESTRLSLISVLDSLDMDYEVVESFEQIRRMDEDCIGLALVGLTPINEGDDRTHFDFSDDPIKGFSHWSIPEDGEEVQLLVLADVEDLDRQLQRS
jgi:hypothetical protein